MTPEGSRHPGRALRMAGDYGWRFLVLAGVAYVLIRVLTPIYDVIVVLVAALLVTALLQPVAVWVRSRGISRGVSTLITVLFVFVVVGGILAFVIIRGIQDFPALGDQVNRLIPHVKHWLINGPLHVNADRVNNLSQTISNEISKNSKSIASSAYSTGKTVLAILAGLVLGLFLVIFMIYDGRNIWSFVVRLFPPEARPRVDAVGLAVFRTLSSYIRGTLIVAIFHGAVIAVALSVLGVPLVAPLALLVGLGAFIPLIGAVVAGAVAVAVAGITVGWVGALVVLIVLVVDNQVEAHLLQPFVVGRYVHIHPVATVLALACGELLLGLFGAIIAVPAAACINAGVQALTASAPTSPQTSPDTGASEPPEP